MSTIKLAGICILTSTLALSGCVARTYNLTRGRVDQDLSSSSGNRGYITGQAPEASERTATRTVRVFEIELGKTKKTNAGCPAATPLAISTEEPALTQGQGEQSENITENFEQYTVEKNDTLQKISKKFYGTTKKWAKIYEANKDVLRGPDKLYPGQTLKIPSASGAKIIEPKENLK